MYEKVYAALKGAINDNRENTRRRFPRRIKDICVFGIGDTNYPVHDWSQCGVLFEADKMLADYEAGVAEADLLRRP